MAERLAKRERRAARRLRQIGVKSARRSFAAELAAAKTKIEGVAHELLRGVLAAALGFGGRAGLPSPFLGGRARASRMQRRCRRRASAAHRRRRAARRHDAQAFA